MGLNTTALGYLALLFIVIASVAIGLKLVYVRGNTKRLTRKVNFSSRRSLAAVTFVLAPAVHQRADAVLARIAILTQRAKGVNVWANFETKDIGVGPKGQSDCQ